MSRVTFARDLIKKQALCVAAIFKVVLFKPVKIVMRTRMAILEPTIMLAFNKSSFNTTDKKSDATNTKNQHGFRRHTKKRHGLKIKR